MTLKKALEKLKSDYELEIRSYSGRGMYGKECLSIVTNQDLLEILLVLGAMIGDNSELDDAVNVHQDYLGKNGKVLYWPEIPFEEEDEKN